MTIYSLDILFSWFGTSLLFHVQFWLAWSQFSTVQLLSRVRLFATPWIAARQASLSITNSWSSLKLMCIASVMPSSCLILCRSLLFLPPILPSIIRLIYKETDMTFLCSCMGKFTQQPLSLNRLANFKVCVSTWGVPQIKPLHPPAAKDASWVLWNERQVVSIPTLSRRWDS